MKPPGNQTRLLERTREVLRLHQYSLATEKVYLQWIRRFMLFHGKRHPNTMGKDEVEAYLTHLAVKRRVVPTYTHVVRRGALGAMSPLDR